MRRLFLVVVLNLAPLLAHADWWSSGSSQCYRVAQNMTYQYAAAIAGMQVYSLERAAQHGSVEIFRAGYWNGSYTNGEHNSYPNVWYERYGFDSAQNCKQVGI